MNRLECGLFQITQDTCRCNIDGFQLITGLYNSGKWEQNHMSFVYSFSLCICTFICESCSTGVSKYKQSYSVFCSITPGLVSLLSRFLLGSCYAKCFFVQRSVYLEHGNAAFCQEDFSKITPNRRAENCF